MDGLSGSGPNQLGDYRSLVDNQDAAGGLSKFDGDRHLVFTQEAQKIFRGHAPVAPRRAVGFQEVLIDPIGYRPLIRVEHVGNCESGQIFRLFCHLLHNSSRPGAHITTVPFCISQS
jgi:hypothetical protein